MFFHGGKLRDGLENEYGVISVSCPAFLNWQPVPWPATPATRKPGGSRTTGFRRDCAPKIVIRMANDLPVPPALAPVPDAVALLHVLGQPIGWNALRLLASAGPQSVTTSRRRSNAPKSRRRGIWTRCGRRARSLG